MKSAYEIALEKAEKIVDDIQEDESLVKREKVKPLLAQFFKGKVDADELWQKLKSKDDPEIFAQAQLILIDSLGLQSSKLELEQRKKGILAVETLKIKQNSPLLEQTFAQITNLIEQYNREKENLTKQIEELMEQNSEMKMKPVQTQDGQTVMQLDSDLDDETKKSFAQEIKRLETIYNSKFKQLINTLKKELE